MLQLNIPTEEAVKMLTNRMSDEFKLRKRAGIFPHSLEISELTFAQLLSIAETAAFDLVMLLPADYFLQESNLYEVVANAVKSLSTIFYQNEFAFYSEKRARLLLTPIIKIFRNYVKDDLFRYN